jgi:hypothetical protein
MQIAEKANPGKPKATGMMPGGAEMKSAYLLLFALAALKFVLPYLIQDPSWEPHRDEFLYLDEARHMAWGYMEVPPLLSVFAWLTNLLGGSMFMIKFWPSLF